MEKGKLIILEGIDGCGKSTTVEKLFMLLQSIGISVTRMESPINDVARSLIFDGFKKNDSSNGEMIGKLYVMDKLVSLPKIVEILDSGTTIIMSRYYLSNAAYNMNGDGCKDFIPTMISFIIEYLRNYQVYNILLDISVEEALKRIDSRNESKDIFETKEKLTEVYQRYQDLFSEKTVLALSNTSIAHTIYHYIIDATQSPDKVSDDIMKLVFSVQH